MSEELIEKIVSGLDSSSKYYVEDKNYPIYENNLGNKVKLHDGICYPIFIRNLDCSKNIELRPDDTFVIGFPKSGTTWVEVYKLNPAHIFEV